MNHTHETTLVINRQSNNGVYTDSKVPTIKVRHMYLHGDLEEGWDMFGFVGSIPTKIGSYPVVVLGSEKPATLFFWGTEFDTPNGHGLVVNDDDKEAVIFAESEFLQYAYR